MGAPDFSECVCPDPSRFTVLRTCVVGSALVVELQYEGCANHEGRKVLVYEKLSNAEFLRFGRVDPHFCDNANCPSPVARFEPTQRGWQLAVSFAVMLVRG